MESVANVGLQVNHNVCPRSLDPFYIVTRWNGSRLLGRTSVQLTRANIWKATKKIFDNMKHNLNRKEYFSAFFILAKLSNS